MAKLDRYWALLILLLVAIVAGGGILVVSKYSRSQAIEISLEPRPKLQGEIAVTGAVNNPGIYPFQPTDSLGAVIQGAGGTAAGADMGGFKLLVPGVQEEEQSQKVNINRAEAWLLQALPGIGETRAQAIVAYRLKNGRFRDIAELAKVEGIGTTTFEKIKHLISVTD